MKKRTSSLSSKMHPQYKAKNDDFVRIFKNLPSNERLLVDCSCAMQKNILLQGRLYISQNWFCFFSSIAHKEKAITIPIANISSIAKAKSARFIPNALQICTKSEKFLFVLIRSRDKVYTLIHHVWNKILSPQLGLSQSEIWLWIHYCYGEDLGLALPADAPDYVAPTDEQKRAFINSVIQSDPSSRTLSNSSEVFIPSPTNENGIDNDLDLSPVFHENVINGTSSHELIDVNMNQLLRRHKGRKSKVVTTPDSPSETSDSGTPGGHNSSNQSLNTLRASTGSSTSTVHSERLNGRHSLDSTPRGVKENGYHEEEEEEKREDGETDEDVDEISISESANHVERDDVCHDHDHFSYKALDDVFHINIEDMFKLLFTNCPMQRELAKRREIFEMDATDWSVAADEKGFKQRTMTYTVPLNISFCPKRSTSVETQLLYPSSQPGKFYMVDSDCNTKNIPYGDSFAVATRYYLARVSRHSCRLCITTQVKYHKAVMGIIRGLIYKAVITGVDKNYSILSELLRKEADGSSLDPPRPRSNSDISRNRNSDPIPAISRRDTKSVSYNELCLEPGSRWTLPATGKSRRLGNVGGVEGESHQVHKGSVTQGRVVADSDGMVVAQPQRDSSTRSVDSTQSLTSNANSPRVLSALQMIFIIVGSLLFAVLVIINIVLLYKLFALDSQTTLRRPETSSSSSSSSSSSQTADMKSAAQSYIFDFSDSDASNRHASDLISRMAELQEAHFVKIYETLSMTTNLMQLIQRSLEQLLAKAEISASGLRADEVLSTSCDSMCKYSKDSVKSCMESVNDAIVDSLHGVDDTAPCQGISNSDQSEDSNRSSGLGLVDGGNDGKAVHT